MNYADMNAMSEKQCLLRYVDVRKGQIVEVNNLPKTLLSSDNEFYICNSLNESEFIPIKNVLDVFIDKMHISRSEVLGYFKKHLKIREIELEQKVGTLEDFFESIGDSELKGSSMFVTGISEIVSNESVYEKLRYHSVTRTGNITKFLTFVLVLGSKEVKNQKIQKAIQLRNEGANIRFIREKDILEILKL